MKRLLLITMFSICSIAAMGNPTLHRLQKAILEDPYMDKVSAMAKQTISTGLNAGSGYGEVWIRDFNTFITTAMDVMSDEKIRESLNTFFHFQGEDGNIADGYIPIARTDLNQEGGYKYRLSKDSPEYAAHKNTVETDQEASLIQAVYQYISKSGNVSYLDTVIGGISVERRMEMALEFLYTKKFDTRYGLITGATTADWGDVQPEHGWGVAIDENTHYSIDIYDNAMFILAIKDYVKMNRDNASKEKWNGIAENIKRNARQHLWDEKNQKFIPHIYLGESPFPEDFDENEIYYHGGTAVAALAGILTKEEIGEANQRMLDNVRKANAQTIGLTMYPAYPQGYFQNAGMYPYGYQNGGDWTWFGARMIWALVENGYIEEAYKELQPMLQRVVKNNGFNEWYTPAGEPKGSGTFRGEAGVLATAINMLEEWAENYNRLPLSYADGTTVIFTFGQSNAANHGRDRFVPETNVLNYFEGKLFKGEDPLIGATGNGACPWTRLAEMMNKSGKSNGVTLISAAVGGTSINDWQKDGFCYDKLIRNIENIIADHIKIDYILWHQGESDNISGMGKEEYIEKFLKIREEFRSRGIDAPIVVAQASYHPDTDPAKNCISKEIRSAQKELAKKYKDIYAGPDTDKLDKAMYRADGIHFSYTGLDLHAAAWLKAIR